MLIMTAEGWKPIVPADSPHAVACLPDCRPVAAAGAAFLPVLTDFLASADSRFLDREWHDRKMRASVGIPC